MSRIRDLSLNEFSIVWGDDVQPANPGAKAVVFKATKKEGAEQMSKTAETTAPELSLAEKIGRAVKDVLKGTRTYNDVSTYSSRSESTSTVTEEDPQPEVTVVVANTEKTTPTTPAATTPAIAEDVISKALSTALNPFRESVQKFEDRLVAIERTSVGSRQVGKAFGGGTQVFESSESKFGEFTKYLQDFSKLSPGQKLTKSTISSGGWSYGLSYAEAGTFIDYIVDQSVLLKQCRTIKMPDKTFPVDKIGLGSTVLKKGTPGTDPGDTVSLSGPTQVLLNATEVVGIVSIGDDTVEDNIEGEAFIQHLLGMIARAAANELEQAAIHGDTGVADSGILDRFDGWYKLAIAGGHVIEGMTAADRYWPGTAPVAKKMTQLLKALPSKYRQDPASLRAILHPDAYLDYNDALATLGYANAWGAVAGLSDLPVRGVPNLKTPMLSTTMSFTYSSTPYTDGTFVMLTDLRNLIFGIHRGITIEPYRQPRKRATEYVLSMRGDVKIENADAIAIYNHLKIAA